MRKNTSEEKEKIYSYIFSKGLEDCFASKLYVFEREATLKNRSRKMLDAEQGKQELKEICVELVRCAFEVHLTPFDTQSDIIKDFVLNKITLPYWQWAFKRIIDVLEHCDYYPSDDLLTQIFWRRNVSRGGIHRAYAYKGGTHGQPDALLYVMYKIVEVVDDLDFIEWVMINFSYGDRVVIDVNPNKIKLPYLKTMLRNQGLRKDIYANAVQERELWFESLHKILSSYSALDAEALDLMARTKMYGYLPFPVNTFPLLLVLHPAFDFSTINPAMMHSFSDLDLRRAISFAENKNWGDLEKRFDYLRKEENQSTLLT